MPGSCPITSTVRNHSKAFGGKHVKTHGNGPRWFEKDSPQKSARRVLALAGGVVCHLQVKWGGFWIPPGRKEGARGLSAPQSPLLPPTPCTQPMKRTHQEPACSPMLLAVGAEEAGRGGGCWQDLLCGHVRQIGFDSRNGMRSAVNQGCHWEQGRVAALSPDPSNSILSIHRQAKILGLLFVCLFVFWFVFLKRGVVGI